ncbi:hypothetical protein BVY00_02695 [bacterium G20]|nr:hypothetical protein BVY00_02695 [bacterium G20]
MNNLLNKIWVTLISIFTTTLRHIRNHWHKVILITLALFMLFQTGLLAWNTTHRSRPVAGLRLGHQPVSSFEGQNLLHKINDLITQTEAKPLLLTTGSTQERITPRQLGAKYNTSLIESRVLETGRKGSMLHRLIDQDAALLGLRNISFGFDTVDHSIALAYLNNLNKQISTAAIEAHFDYQNGQVGIVKEQAGQELNVSKVEALLQQLGQQDTQPTNVDIPLNSIKATITADDLKPLLPQAQSIVNQPIVLQAAGKQVSVSSAELSQIIIAVRQPDPNQPTQTKVAVGFSDAKLGAAIDKLATQVSTDPQPKIVSGRTVISQGSSGTHVDGTHAKVEVVSELLKREQSPVAAPPSTTTPKPATTPAPAASTPASTTSNPSPAPTPSATTPKPPAPAPEPPPVATPTVIPIEVGEVAAPVVSQYTETNPSGRYPANIGDKKMIYLTFDDGPGSYTEQILDILKKYNVHGIFFLVGRNMIVYPNSVKRIKAEGHSIGNHSYTHVDLSKLNSAGITDELSKTQKTIKDIAAVQADLFRPPYGSIDSKVFDAMTKQQLSLMMWSIDPRDWSKPGTPEITKRVVSGLKPGGNVLLHVLHQQTAEALPSIIESIRARGYTLN